MATMSSKPPHVYGLVLLPSERNALASLIERYGTESQREHLGHLISAAPDMGSVAALAATIETPGRQASIPHAQNDAADGRFLGAC